jgi:hypothetical protein
VQIHYNNMSNMLRVTVVSRALLQAAALAVRHDQTGCAVVWWLGGGGKEGRRCAELGRRGHVLLLLMM